jgi:predicted 3-demethylubiquinone-9 3-methyltransferase (glyoxalase superfamily)
MAVIQKIAPCLWFDGQAEEEAAKFYTLIERGTEGNERLRTNERRGQEL